MKKTKKNNTTRKQLELRYPGILQWYNTIHKSNPHKCENCGRTSGKINAHHILGKAAFPEYAIHSKNWILLCRTCHKLIHRKSKMQQQTLVKKKLIEEKCQNKIKNTPLYNIYIKTMGVVNPKMKSENNSKTKKIFQYNGIRFDSNQEIFFYKWCEQALIAGILEQFLYHPGSYILSQAKFYNGKKILHPHVYTPDFNIKVSEIGRIKLQKVFKVFNFDNLSIIQIKPAYSPYGSIEEFSINRKWIYEKYNLFIEKIEIDSFFNKTWCPESCKLTDKTKKIRDKYKYCNSVNTFIQRGNNEKFTVQKIKKSSKAL